MVCPLGSGRGRIPCPCCLLLLVLLLLLLLSSSLFMVPLLMLLSFLMFCSGLRGTLLVLDDVWEASVVEAFETVGLSLLVTTREVCVVLYRAWLGRSRLPCVVIVARVAVIVIVSAAAVVVGAHTLAAPSTLPARST